MGFATSEERICGSHFLNIEFSGSVGLSTHFRHDPEGRDVRPGAVFARAKFVEPEDVVFYRTYLGQALFHLCDVSKINFSDVTWRRRKDGGQRMAFEEKVCLGNMNAEALKPADGSHDERNFVLIAELYQQLGRKL